MFLKISDEQKQLNLRFRKFRKGKNSWFHVSPIWGLANNR
jgi:hypothetical protein